MKRRIAGWMLMVAALAAVAGCSKPGLTGAWNGSIAGPRGTVDITLSFAPDGKFTQTYSMPQKINVVCGTYTAKDDTLLLTAKTVTNNATTMPSPDTTPKQVKYKLDGDKLTITDPSGVMSVTFTRVKS